MSRLRRLQAAQPTSHHARLGSPQAMASHCEGRYDQTVVCCTHHTNLPCWTISTEELSPENHVHNLSECPFFPNILVVLNLFQIFPLTSQCLLYPPPRTQHAPRQTPPSHPQCFPHSRHPIHAKIAGWCKECSHATEYWNKVALKSP